MFVCVVADSGWKRKGTSYMRWDTSAVLIIWHAVFQPEETKRIIQRQWLLITLWGSWIVSSRDHMGMEPISILWGDDGG